jgi:hypothetical protein
MPTISQLFGGRAPQSDSDDVVLAPQNINPRSSPSLQPDEFRLYGKVYVRCCSLAKQPKATRKRQSVIWKYGEDIQLRTNSTKRHWYCYLCEKKRDRQELPIVDKGNSTCLDHLKQKHHIDPQTGEPLTAEDHTQTTINGPSLSTLIFRRDFDVFKDLLIRWIVYCHIAFFQMENAYFRGLLFYLSPWLSKLLPKAACTIRQWVKDAFLMRKERLKKDLNEARSRVSISMDAWTSPSFTSILGVAAHFIDKFGNRRTTILALRQLQGVHSGENMAGVLLQIFNEYNIQNRIGYFMADNHEANDTCIDTLLQELYPWMTVGQRKRRRLRCAGHIINLCAHAFIMGKDAEKIAREMDAALREGDLKKIGELWRKRGALGRLHNVIRYIRASPQRREFFGKQVCGGELAEFDGLEVSSFQLSLPLSTPFLPQHKCGINDLIGYSGQCYTLELLFRCNRSGSQR